MAAAPAHATPEATQGHAARQRPLLGGAAFRPLGRTGLSVSGLGFGGYRIDAENPEHREALERALDGGANLIDTSSNYTDGGSETLIGRVLAGRAEARPAIVVVSKAGYVQGQNMHLARRAAAEGRPFAEMVEYHPQCWHCIHPDFLEDQLGRTLGRLGLAALDVYLLHNPEYYFSDWAHRQPSGDVEAARTEFYRRCQEAFVWMERQVAAGRLRWYGVSSNTFGHASAHPESVSLERLLAAAEAAAGQAHGRGAASHFAVAQCPLNLFEAGPALEPNQSGGRTFLQLALAEGVGVLVNRPLNAIRGGKLTRLAGAAPLRAGWADGLEQALSRQEALERDFAARFRPAIAGSLPPDAEPLDPFHWSDAFRSLPDGLRQPEEWANAVHGSIFPQIERNAQAVMELLEGVSRRQEFSAWFRDFAIAVEASAALVAEGLTKYQQDASSAVQARLAPRLPEALRGLPLSQQALLVALSTPGVACVLNGARRPRYVDDSLGALALPPLAPAQSLDVLRGLAEA